MRFPEVFLNEAGVFVQKPAHLMDAATKATTSDLSGNIKRDIGEI
jgi:hypothetical protein